VTKYKAREVGVDHATGNDRSGVRIAPCQDKEAADQCAQILGEIEHENGDVRFEGIKRMLRRAIEKYRADLAKRSERPPCPTTSDPSARDTLTPGTIGSWRASGATERTGETSALPPAADSGCIEVLSTMA
jgi:hypothetical protein